MSILNRVMMIGNLTADPVVRETGKGNLVASFSMALNHRTSRREGSSGGEETTFVDVVVWDRMAENASEYLHKGSGVLIEGRLQQDRWEDKETGQKRSKLQVVGERMRFLGGASRNEERQSDPPRSGRGSSEARASSAPSQPSQRRREYASSRE